MDCKDNMPGLENHRGKKKPPEAHKLSIFDCNALVVPVKTVPTLCYHEKKECVDFGQAIHSKIKKMPFCPSKTPKSPKKYILVCIAEPKI